MNSAWLKRKHIQGPLRFSKSVIVYHNNIHIFTAVVHKIINDIFRLIVNIFFSFGENKYSLRNFQEIKQQKHKTCSIQFWNSSLPSSLKVTF